MDRIPLKAQERTLLGKKVKHLRKDGLVPGHVYGKGEAGENVTVLFKDFLEAFNQAGETGLVNLKIGEDKVRPVLIRQVQHNPVTGQILNIDFYQVNLKEKVKVPVPIVLIGEEAEAVHLGEAVVLQNLSEIEVEALPDDLIEKIEVDITVLKNIDDAITVGQLNFNREALTITLDSEEVVVKLAPAVTEEMKKLLEEQQAEAAEAAAEAVAEEGGEVKAEGEEGESEEGKEGEVSEGGDEKVEAKEETSEETQKE